METLQGIFILVTIYYIIVYAIKFALFIFKGIHIYLKGKNVYEEIFYFFYAISSPFIILHSTDGFFIFISLIGITILLNIYFISKIYKGNKLNCLLKEIL